jgi:replicative DNA helicase
MIITNRPKNPGQGFHIVKNKRVKLPINFDLNSLNLMCTYVLTENRNIKRGQYINLRNLIELLDMEKYINDQERYKRVLFIRKALEGRLVKGLNDPVAIVKYVNGGLLDSDIIDINNFIGMSNSEIDWINETVSNTLSSSFLYENAQEGIDILTRFLAAEAKDISSTFSEAREWIRRMNNEFRRNEVSKASDRMFSLKPDEFSNMIRDVHQEVTSNYRHLVTGMQGFNQLIGGGFENTRCYLLLGLTGVGKSLTMLNIAYQLKKYNKGFKPKDPTKIPCVVILSMENTVTETIQRLFTIATGEDIRNFSPEEAEQILRTTGELYLSDDSPIDIIVKYQPNRSVDTGYLYTLCEDLEDEGYEVICMIQDHVKRIRAASGNPDLRLELGDVVNEMKTFAIIKDIPVLTDSHLNREGARVIDQSSTRATMDLTRMLGKSNIGESLLMLDNIDVGTIINKECDADGNEYMVFKNIKERVQTFRSYICQPFHKDNPIKLIEDFYSPVPVFRESLYNEPTMNTQHHNNNVKNNSYNANIITIDDDDENLFEYSKVYSSEDVKPPVIEIREEEEQPVVPNIANFANPYGFNPIPVVQEEPQLTRGVYYVA